MQISIFLSQTMKLPTQITFTLLICFLCIGKLYSQVGYDDVVYLKNGSIIHGMIIEQVPGQSLKIQTRDRNIFVYKMDEVQKIAKEYTGSKKRYEEVSEMIAHPYSGFTFGIETSIGSGISNYNTNRSTIAAHALFGYMHKSKFTVGARTGFSNWDINKHTDNTPVTTVELSVAVRVHPLLNRFSPMLLADAGYGIVNDNFNATGGLIINTGVGGRINLTQKRGIGLSVCYKMQRITLNSNVYNYYTNLNTEQTKSFWLQAICLNAAFYF